MTAGGGAAELPIHVGRLEQLFDSMDPTPFRERDLVSEYRYGILAESLVIGGWVATWRPIEIFLYDWWPVRAEARLHDRLAGLSVSVVPSG